VIFVGGSGWAPDRGEGIGWFPLGPREVYIPSYTVSATYVQRINIAYAININVQVIEKYNPDRAVYANRSAPRALTVVPRDVFVQSRPAGRAAISLSSAEVTRAPLMGITARVAPQRESIIAKPAARQAPVPPPPPAIVSQRFVRVSRRRRHQSPSRSSRRPWPRTLADLSIPPRSPGCSAARKPLNRLR
jgi:hypothetical protein